MSYLYCYLLSENVSYISAVVFQELTTCHCMLLLSGKTFILFPCPFLLNP